MGAPPARLPDPLDPQSDIPTPNDPRGSTEELLSQLAGEDIDRLMSGLPRRTSDEGAPAGPVQQLTHQLDNFFEELRQRQSPPPPALRTDALQDSHDEPPDEQDFTPTQEELDSLHGIASPPPRALFPPRVQPIPRPGYLKPLDWLSNPIESLSPRGRMAMGVLSILSFLTGCGALAYVLMLRR